MRTGERPGHGAAEHRRPARAAASSRKRRRRGSLRPLRRSCGSACGSGCGPGSAGGRGRGGAGRGPTPAAAGPQAPARTRPTTRGRRRRPGRQRRRRADGAGVCRARRRSRVGQGCCSTRGADVNQTTEYGWTPLLTATNNRHYKLGTYPARARRQPEPRQQGRLDAAVSRDRQPQHRGRRLSGAQAGHGSSRVHQAPAGPRRQPERAASRTTR